MHTYSSLTEDRSIARCAFFQLPCLRPTFVWRFLSRCVLVLVFDSSASIAIRVESSTLISGPAIAYLAGNSWTRSDHRSTRISARTSPLLTDLVAIDPHRLIAWTGRNPIECTACCLEHSQRVPSIDANFHFIRPAFDMHGLSER